LIDNLQRSAALFAHRCAIQQEDRAVTYAELLDLAQKIAASLRSGGLEPGDRAALILPNGPEFVAAYYGALMAGAVVVPLSSGAKAGEIGVWLADCTPSWVLMHRSDPEVVRVVETLQCAPQIVFADQDWSAVYGCQISNPQDCDPRIKAQSDTPACILYTSGTTGHPKGVVLTHGNLAENAASIVECLRLTHEDSIVNVLPFCYSYGSSVLHSHLRAGGRIVIEPNFVYPHEVVKTLSTQRTSGFAGVPSTFALLMSRVNLRDYDLSSLRYVTQAGGAMSPALTRRLCNALPFTEVIIMYGQTEATARLTFLPARRLADKLGSVGVAIPGVKIQIRDEFGGPVPTNQAGEVWAHGPGTMAGYWRDEVATAAVKQDGWLKTGDVGRLDEEGYLYLVGRRSDMIKVGANRVHPQDIEDVIAELPQVQEVAVVGIDDEMLGESIKAYVVPVAATRMTQREVQAHCRTRLANHKIPKIVEFVLALPKTATGKIRRVELSEKRQ